MSLMDFDNDLKEAEQEMKQKAFDDHISKMKADGMSDYGIERHKEMLLLKPEKMQRFEAAVVKNVFDVKFYFNEEDWELFKRHFGVLSYQESNSNDNWLLLGLLRLIEEGKIQYSAKSKEVWVV